MPLTEIDIQGYRSLRNIQLPLQQLNVITGPNGSGKSNLYRSLWLIARICEGQFAASICREGGLLSAMWAGPRTNAKKGLRMTLGFRHDDFHFQISCGFPTPSNSLFVYDPQIKEELVWFGPHQKPTTTLLERSVGMTWIRDTEGNRVEYPLTLDANESVLSQLREPHRYPELFSIREAVRSWRFYHTFRTDDEAPLRFPQVSVRTCVLSHDGSDLAAALQTIRETGGGAAFNDILTAAFPGRSLQIVSSVEEPWTKSPHCTELSVGLTTEGCARPLLARELSDGTLKFLCLAACLSSPCPPPLIALNEPEASLHPDLLPPLAKLIVETSKVTQVCVCTHSTVLTEAIQSLSGVEPIRLQLRQGETVVDQSFRGL
ncbi:MAG: AAA family ATPase [Planctomycetes bacterium]|nr:AAA family ATPase [Planctomycetota bacterium]